MNGGRRGKQRFDEILIEGREDLLKYINSKFEGLSLRNTESLRDYFTNT